MKLQNFEFPEHLIILKMGNEQGGNGDHTSFRDHLDNIENKLSTKTKENIDYSTIEPNENYKKLQAGQLKLRFAVLTYADDDEKNPFKNLAQGNLYKKVVINNTNREYNKRRSLDNINI